MDDGWIVIPNWNRFQHYKERNPTWIKVYTDLLDNPDYLSLTAHQTGVLHRLWLEYARSRCQIRDSTATVTRQLGVRVSRATLQALNHAGFIEFSASRPLAYTRSRDLEVLRTSREGASRPPKGGDGYTTEEADPEPPRHERLLAEAQKLAANWNGDNSDVFEEQLDVLELSHRDHLKALERYDLWETACRR